MEKELPREEKIKQLIKKKEELKKAIEQKKKELEELKKKVEKEEEATEEEIRRSFEELLEEEQEQLKELEKKLKKEENLEEAVEEATEEITEEVRENINYEQPLESLIRETPDIYLLTNYQLYQQLKKLEEKPYLTREEQELLATVSYQTNIIRESYNQQVLREKDPLYYLDRVENIIKKLSDRLYKPKE